MGYNPNKICDLYVSGFKKKVKGAFIIGLAATIKTILVEGQILDTITYFMSMCILKLPVWDQLTGIFWGNDLLNLLITSGSGQAALIMPILVPMSDILNLSRQSIVLAFQIGDGLQISYHLFQLHSLRYLQYQVYTTENGLSSFRHLLLFIWL